MKKKGSGRSQRQSFLDRDVVQENREIMAYNRQLERQARESERQRETERTSQALLASIKAPQEYQWAVKELVERISRRERFGDAAKATWVLVQARTETSQLPLVRAQWNAVLTTVAQKAQLLGVRGVPAGLLKEVDEFTLAMTEAGLSVEGAESLERMVRRAVEMLTEGVKIADVNDRVWRWAVRGMEAADRRELAPKWAVSIRKIGDVWAQKHPEDTLISIEEERAQRRAKAVMARKSQLLEAASQVDSWPIFSYEGEVMIDALSEGVPVKEALGKAGELLQERAPKVSPAEWQVIKAEWAKITSAVTERNQQLSKR